MLTKVLKRKVSKVAFQAPDPSQLSISGNSSGSSMLSSSGHLPFQYDYRRPELVGTLSDEESSFYSNHQNRPVLIPKQPLPQGVGYAEVINAGKSRYNEDQAAVREGKLKAANGTEVPYLFVGVFDGHGGSGTGVKVAKELHQIVHESLEDVLPYMLNPDKLCEPTDDALKEDEFATETEQEEEDESETVEVKMSVDELICGALESSFWAMDRKILIDKDHYKITGGATCVVTLLIFNKLYVANAGDSRAVAFMTGGMIRPMSRDHTPMADRRRIQEIAFHRPELLRHPETKDKLFNRHILARKVTKEDIGASVMYKDYYMSGWSARDVTYDDVDLIQIISGRGKQCRLLSTVGVARSLGDHDLLAKGCGIRIKEFMTPAPEVRVLDLSTLNGQEFLVMGTDGLWDVLSLREVQQVISEDGDAGPQVLAQQLVTTARGERVPDQYWEMKNKRLASGDDITAIVVALKQCRK